MQIPESFFKLRYVNAVASTQRMIFPLKIISFELLTKKLTTKKQISRAHLVIVYGTV